MKTLKKIIGVLFLLSIMMLSLVGCSSNFSISNKYTNVTVPTGSNQYYITQSAQEKKISFENGKGLRVGKYYQFTTRLELRDKPTFEVVDDKTIKHFAYVDTTYTYSYSIINDKYVTISTWLFEYDNENGMLFKLPENGNSSYSMYILLED